MAQDNSKMIRWVREIPLAIASFLIFKLLKLIIGVLYALYLGANRQLFSQWRLLSADTLASPLSLPVLMTKGPRWNTHAIIGTVGPFKVKEELALDGRAIAQSARSWTAAIYSYPSYRTVDNLGSLETPIQKSIDELSGDNEKSWVSLRLKPGRYSIGLRYYHSSATPVMPAVRIDGNEAIVPHLVDPNINAFYKDLAERTNGFYRALHFYVFTILKLRQWLPASFVRQEYLPVGAPETHFFYDALEAGDRLTLHLAQPLVEHFDLYLTTYNRASFPLFWEGVESDGYISQPMPTDGFYLIRIRPKSPNSTEFSSDWFQATVICCD